MSFRYFIIIVASILLETANNVSVAANAASQAFAKAAASLEREDGIRGLGALVERNAEALLPRLDHVARAAAALGAGMTDVERNVFLRLFDGYAHSLGAERWRAVVGGWHVNVQHALASRGMLPT